MNFVFVSPHFPKSYWNFCDRLRRNGVNVLGVGDAPYDEIPGELKACLTEYYRVSNLADYDQMVRAVGYFTFKYGKIDWLVLAGDGRPAAHRFQHHHRRAE